MSGINPSGTIANGIGGSASFSDVSFTIVDALTHKIPPSGSKVTFSVVAAGQAGGPLTCSVPAAALTNALGVAIMHGATATNWPGSCTYTATTPGVKLDTTVGTSTAIAFLVAALPVVRPTGTPSASFKGS
jgi:hypothetical protein